MKNKIQALFKSNSKNNIVFSTSDGYCFWEKPFAEAHASRLEDKTVAETTREQAEKFEPESGENKVSEETESKAVSEPATKKAKSKTTK